MLNFAQCLFRYTNINEKLKKFGFDVINTAFDVINDTC